MKQLFSESNKNLDSNEKNFQNNIIPSNESNIKICDQKNNYKESNDKIKTNGYIKEEEVKVEKSNQLINNSISKTIKEYDFSNLSEKYPSIKQEDNRNNNNNNNKNEQLEELGKSIQYSSSVEKSNFKAKCNKLSKSEDNIKKNNELPSMNFNTHPMTLNENSKPIINSLITDSNSEKINNENIQHPINKITHTEGNNPIKSIDAIRNSFPLNENLKQKKNELDINIQNKIRNSTDKNNQYSEAEMFQSNQRPIMLADINLDGNLKDRIIVYKNDDPKKLAENFGALHGINNNRFKCNDGFKT